MASRNGSGRKSGKDNQKAFRGFINVTFTDRERSEVNLWLEGRNLDAESLIIGFCEQGYKISVSFDTWNDCWFVSLTAKKTGTKYDGYCIVISHGDLTKALSISAYVVDVLMENGGLPIPGDKEDLNW